MTHRFTVKDYHRLAEADIFDPEDRVELLDGEVIDVGSAPTIFRFTVDDFHRMADADIFDPEARVELLDGEVVELTPIGTRHSGCVNRLNAFFTAGLGARVVVAVQNPMQIGDFSQPQPDLVVLRARPDFYSEHHPLPPDVLLAVEVADTSLRYDLLRKAPLYVAGGIQEVWVADLADRIVHVFREGMYAERRAGDTLAPAAFPDLTLEVATILG